MGTNGERGLDQPSRPETTLFEPPPGTLIPRPVWPKTTDQCRPPCSFPVNDIELSSPGRTSLKPRVCPYTAKSWLQSFQLDCPVPSIFRTMVMRLWHFSWAKPVQWNARDVLKDHVKATRECPCGSSIVSPPFLSPIAPGAGFTGQPCVACTTSRPSGPVVGGPSGTHSTLRA